MRFFALATVLFLGLSAHAQHDFQVWTELGVSGKITKKLSWDLDLNSRFGNDGVETFFPQLGIEYKVKKWFRPSIDYRYILDKDKYGNMLGGHRINVNANFEKGIERFEVEGRLRYQYAFNRIESSTESNLDFNQAVRLKGGVQYDIDNSIFTPLLNAELFYDPQFENRGLSKIRIALGTKLELDGPHKISFKYQIDKRFEYGKDLRHVISIGYGYKL